LLRLRGGRRPLPSHRPHGLRAFRSGNLPAVQEVVRRILLPPPSRRAPRDRRHLLRRPPGRGIRPLLRPSAQRRRLLPAGLPADPAAPEGRALRRARTRLSALPPRTLRRVQSGVGPRDPIRPAVGRADGVDPDVSAAPGALALWLAAGAGDAGGAAL